MNKEQTPITAEEKREDLLNQYCLGKMSNDDFWNQLDKIYTQAKVLEALERYEDKIKMYWAEQYAEIPPKELLLRNTSKTKV